MSDSLSASRLSRPWLAVGLVLVAIATWMRIHNGFEYFVLYGFDAPHNWKYIELLKEFWVLPHPEHSWSTARPPLFFHLAGGLARLIDGSSGETVPWIRLASSAVGLGAIGLVAAFVWQQASEPRQRTRRAVLAAGLLLFLPAHIALSAMLNEEILVGALTTLALYLYLRDLRSPTTGARENGRMVAIGLAAGLALLTKLTGLLAIGALVLAELIAARAGGNWRSGLRRAAILGGVALAAGGWFYARSLVLYGYLYPRDLPAHLLMLEMPPGERSALDYVRVPLTTFTNPRLDDQDLLHSVWGGTYATLWYDGQRHFMPQDDPVVTRMGTLVLVLALVPTLACLIGSWRGWLRALRTPRGPDRPMLLLSVISVAGYVFYTWSNPWFATVKGSYLLGLGLPYAAYSSEVLCEWTRWEPGNQGRAAAVLLCLAALVIAISLAFSFGTPLWEMQAGAQLPGLPWSPVAPH